jgi:UDP-glucose 4-epimerase
VRDYIHVVDLAAGHLAALRRILQNNGAWTANLGTGVGYSVLEVIRAFEIASGCSIKFETAPRRAGDIASCFADPTHAQTLLGWRAHRALDEMCADHWRWQRANPFGYANS